MFFIFHISKTFYFRYIYYMQSPVEFCFLTQSAVSLYKDICHYPICKFWDAFLWFLFRMFWCYLFLSFYLLNKQFLFCVLHTYLYQFGSVWRVRLISIDSITNFIFNILSFLLVYSLTFIKVLTRIHCELQDLRALSVIFPNISRREP